MSNRRWRNQIRPIAAALALSAFGAAASLLPPGAAHAESAPARAADAVGTSRLQPRILIGKDVALYRRIFAAQRAGKWDQADVLVDRLNDRLLMGHVLYQRYMSRTYISKYEELKAWLAHYSHEPGADDIYALALRKAPKHAGALTKPKPAPSIPIGSGDPDDFYPSAKSAAGQRWRAGLDAWADRDYKAAAEAFTSMAHARGLSSAMAAGAAYWAGRAEARNGDDDAAKEWFETAAEQPTTFYGLLALSRLGRSDELQWSKPVLTEATLNRLRRDPGVRRTIALVQIGPPRLAEREMASVYGRKVGGRSGPLLALASNLGLPQAQLRISSDMNLDATKLSTALYPLPFWAPTGGFRVDPAFLFALMRQESRFDADAKSSARARGLMQLMPATARNIAIRHIDSDDDDALFNPIVNMTLGQRYIELLQVDLGKRADPLTLAVAYNLGPNNIRKWRKKMGKGADPLLFIETLSPLQTKLHAKRVLTGFWLYRMRFKHKPTSLLAIAEGHWPAPLPTKFPGRGETLASLQ
jgi:soluble lytic murein transglycosylase-like protein